jgi:hypothetical protein
LLEPGLLSITAAGNDKVVHVAGDDKQVLIAPSNVDTGIRNAPAEAKREKESVEILIPQEGELCFKPYRPYKSLQTIPGGASTPLGTRMYTVCGSLGYRKAVWTSIWERSRSSAAAIANRVRNDLKLTTGENVS